MILFPFLARLVYLTSRFGPRWGTNHNGVDFSAVTGTGFHAPITGQVKIPAVQPKGAGINIWVVDVITGDIWKCFHLSAIVVAHNAFVSAGQLVAFTGNTGASTGPHAHIEYWPGGRKPVDPWPLLQDAEQNGRFPGWRVDLTHTVPFVPQIITPEEFLTMAKFVKVSNQQQISQIAFAPHLPDLEGIDGHGPSGPGRLVGGTVRYDYPDPDVFTLATTQEERDEVHVLDAQRDTALIKAYENLPRTVQAV